MIKAIAPRLGSRSGGAFERLSIQTKVYSEFRPKYPVHLVDWILDGTGSKPNLAVDVGCGIGNLTFALARHVQTVIGIDISEMQLENGRKQLAAVHVNNVKFLKGSALQLSPDMIGVAAGSCDLVTFAQILHWLDREEIHCVCINVQKLLKPDGIMVAVEYGKCEPKNKVICDRFNQFYDNLLDSKGYSVRNCNRNAEDSVTCDIDFSPLHETNRSSFRLSKRLTIDSFAEYIGTWSSVANDERAQSELNEFYTWCKAYLEEDKLEILFPFFAAKYKAKINRLV